MERCDAGARVVACAVHCISAIDTRLAVRDGPFKRSTDLLTISGRPHFDAVADQRKLSAKALPNTELLPKLLRNGELPLAGNRRDFPDARKLLRGNAGRGLLRTSAGIKAAARRLTTLWLFVTGLCRKAGTTARPARAMGPEPG